MTISGSSDVARKRIIDAAASTRTSYSSPVVNFILAKQQKDAEKTFPLLAERWKKQTAGYSSIHRKTQHDAYVAIIRMGKFALPLILEDLSKAPAHWFTALRQITGENPVPVEARGDVAAMRDAWLAWGKAKALL